MQRRENSHGLEYKGTGSPASEGSGLEGSGGLKMSQREPALPAGESTHKERGV